MAAIPIKPSRLDAKKRIKEGFKTLSAALKRDCNGLLRANLELPTNTYKYGNKMYKIRI
jgi:hypothetical protein